MLELHCSLSKENNFMQQDNILHQASVQELDAMLQNGNYTAFCSTY